MGWFTLFLQVICIGSLVGLNLDLYFILIHHHYTSFDLTKGIVALFWILSSIVLASSWMVPDKQATTLMVSLQPSRNLCITSFYSRAPWVILSNVLILVALLFTLGVILVVHTSIYIKYFSNQQFLRYDSNQHQLNKDLIQSANRTMSNLFACQFPHFKSNCIIFLCLLAWNHLHGTPNYLYLQN